MNEETRQVRLFTTIELPEEWLTVLGRAQSQLERVGGGEFKWVRTDLMHLTLVFLGYQDSESLSTISTALDSAASHTSAFDLRLGHLGGFGPPHGLTVIWAGLEAVPPQLSALHQSIAEELASRRVPFDRKPLVPHITLARGRRPINREASLRVSGATKQIDLPRLTAPIGSFVLMRSHLSPKGPTYEVVQSFELGDVKDG